MFIGEHSHTIDTKGRLSIPVKYRQQLTEGVVVTRGLDHCLFLYPKAEWGEIARKLAALPLSQKKSRAFTRLMLAGAWDAELDSQGRVLLPEYLRAFAGLVKQVTVAGVYSRLELWDEDTWHTYRQNTEAASEDIAESLAELGI
ncbi:MAG TPA: division/cell wall cluster transcriptional repressor MraZ [Candidatus Andersenbacteria bacterium]|nr:division/cell wall cluster transcriptional repressor MraZ [Candidatus Andersenbacteria bacterium]